jgi:hypothetical protein
MGNGSPCFEFFTKGFAPGSTFYMVSFVKTTQAVLLFVSVLTAFIIGKEVYPRIVDRPVIVEKVVKVPVEVKVEIPVLKEVIKEVPAKLTSQQSDAVLTYKRIEAASLEVRGRSDNDVLPTTDGKAHPEVDPYALKIYATSPKTRVFISISGAAQECCDKDEIFAIVQARMQQVGLECEIASTDVMVAMFQSPNVIIIQVRLMEASQYAYCGLVSTSFKQSAIGMNSQANPAIGPWKQFSVTPLTEDILIRVGKTAARSYVKENINTQLEIVCGVMAKELKK